MTWTFSPDPDIENAVASVARGFPPLLPAGLHRFEGYLKALSDPHKKIPPVIHAAGTNGKGSTLAFLQAAFEAGGQTVHKFTSPHLVRVNERLVVSGREIEGEALLALIAEGRAAARGHAVSFFEFFTALAFLAFSRGKADVVLLETGLGGLLDATNVVEKSVTVLTRISFDHTHILGGTLEEIAAQKAGIIKQGGTAIAAPQPGAGVMDVFERQAAEKGAPLFRAEREWKVFPSFGEGGGEEGGFVYKSAAHEFRLPAPALKGAHQVVNAGTAIAALEGGGYTALLHQDILESAMRNVIWPGRMQRIAGGPMTRLVPEGTEIWLDGAHNDSGAETLAAELARMGGRFCLITAMKHNKEEADFYAPLRPFVDSVRVLDAEIGAPMMPAGALCTRIRDAGFADVGTAESLESAVSSFSFKDGGGRRILIAGSLFLAGHVLRTHQ